MTIFLVFVIAAVLIGTSYYYNKQKTAKMAAEGKIIERKGGFHEQMQEFTLAPVDPALLTQKLKALPYSDMNVAMNGDSAKQIFRFAHSAFEAQLARVANDAEKSVYVFKFNRWTANKLGAPLGYYKMNMLQTAIEKMFLSLDPKTQVRSKAMQTKTKIW